MTTEKAVHVLLDSEAMESSHVKVFFALNLVVL